MGLNREQIKAAAARRRKLWVPTPEWAAAGEDPAQCGVWSSSISAKQVAAIEGLTGPDGMARLVALTTVDDDGARVLTDEDAAWLAESDLPVLGRLFNAALELNSLKKGEVDGAIKNSESGQPGSLPTGSPLTTASST